ncbi:GNAT family N-acetyltransferase [Paenibacillus sp. sgz500958]|uniref:GNAT family N-acetyltransferase n=1 Tax=Paenibacillus sp. sgz500958 TaxID=3242475 RepID=UPI0036D25B6C
MTTTLTNLFRGQLLRFTASYPGDAEQMSRFSENFDYLANLDTDYAVPQAVHAFKETESRNPSGVEFMLRPLDNDKLIGFVALFRIEWNNQAARLAIGIGDPDNRGKGYGADALQMILRYGFMELNLHRIGLDVIEYNDRAIRAYMKAGFVEEGRMRASVKRGGTYYDRIIMSVLKDEWQIHNNN